MNDTSAVAARLRESREFLNLDHNFVVEQTGIPLATLIKIEKGVHAGSDDEIFKLAELYRLSPTYIRTGKDDTNVSEAASRALNRARGELSERERNNVERFALFLQNFRRE